MDQPVRLKGNFTANPRRYAAGDKPHYYVKLGVPGTDIVFPAGGYCHEYDHTNKDGTIVKLKVISGTADLISPNMSIKAQADAVAAQNDPSKIVTFGKNNKELRPGQFVVFEKADEHKMPKDGVVKLNGKGQPARVSDHYGYWNHNGQLIEIGSWNHQSPDGYFFLGGNTQFPLEREVIPTRALANDVPDFSMSEEELSAMASELAGNGADKDQAEASMERSTRRRSPRSGR